MRVPKRLHEAPERCQMALMRPPKRPRVQEASVETPPGDPKASVKLEEAVEAAVEDASKLFRSKLEAAVEAAVEDASKLFRSRWPRSGLAGSDFARSRSATTRGQ